MTARNGQVNKLKAHKLYKLISKYMFHFFKKEKFPTVVFVAASFLALIIFFMFYLVIFVTANHKAMTKKNSFQSDKYYLNEDYEENDPYVTKVPDLKQMLAGPIISALDPSVGNLNAKVNIVIFGDFTCAFCAKEEAVVKAILAKYPNQIRFIWKDYPDTDVASVSFKAAVAARCAEEQDKFWQYHDKLFSYDNLTEENFLQIADDIKINHTKFLECLNGLAAQKKVKDNIKEADALEITGVPFMYVNKQEVMGEISLEGLDRIVQVELNREN